MHHMSKVEFLSIVTVFLTYVGIDMVKGWNVFKTLGCQVIIIVMLVTASIYIGYAVVARIVLIKNEVPA